MALSQAGDFRCGAPTSSPVFRAEVKTIHVDRSSGLASMSMYVLAIDQGTTGSTVSLVDQLGRIRLQADRDFEQIYPHPGWVEHNPDHIWQSVLQALQELKTRALSSGLCPSWTKREIVGIGITNQRETVVAWDGISGEPRANAIVWQDRRTASICERLRARGLEKRVTRKTGLLLDPYFSATKMGWLLRYNSDVRAARRGLKFGTIDSFLLSRLSGGQLHVTDVSNASRTSLMNIKDLSWDSELLKIFGVPEDSLPEIYPSSHVYGFSRQIEWQGEVILPSDIPLAGAIGDQQSALFGQGCWTVGDAKCTYGTGSFILVNTGSTPSLSRHRCLSTVAWQLSKESNPVYALEGGAFVCGAAVQWLRDGLGLIQKSSEVEALARTVESTDGVVVVPSFTGMGAPHWCPSARAVILGLSRGSHRGHVARATLEGMAFQNVDVLEAMEKDLGRKLRRLRVDGGAAANGLLMSLQADFLGRPVERPRQLETTSLGAAFMAGLAVGFWKNPKILADLLNSDLEVFRPQIKASERSKRIEVWRRAVRLAAGWGG